MKSVLVILFFNAFVFSSFAFESNAIEEEIKMDCDAYAEWVYYEYLDMGMGQQYATDKYMEEHAACTQAGGSSEFETEVEKN